MSDLIAITFDSREAAKHARDEFTAMAREHLVELEDVAIAHADDKGRVRLDQTINLAAAGAANGGFWGMLLGFLFAIPTGGAALPVLSAGIGAGLGALTGKLSDYGIDDDMMREMASGVRTGKATLFVLLRKMTADKALEHLRGLGGTLMTTSLPGWLEAEMQAALDRKKAA